VQGAGSFHHLTTVLQCEVAGIVLVQEIPLLLISLLSDELIMKNLPFVYDEQMALGVLQPMENNEGKVVVRLKLAH
jgi:hypothetical protein